ncbi:hypothetical protein, partial [Paenibacillus alginolyticus]|uniref:hypothetical protein n=1 Tax=Paenibacillus alginolyticus TaxID=59839 RepID=UPI002DBE2559
MLLHFQMSFIHAPSFSIVLFILSSMASLIIFVGNYCGFFILSDQFLAPEQTNNELLTNILSLILTQSSPNDICSSL